jgi:hypothetical protein
VSFLGVLGRIAVGKFELGQTLVETSPGFAATVEITSVVTAGGRKRTTAGFSGELGRIPVGKFELGQVPPPLRGFTDVLNIIGIAAPLFSFEDTISITAVATSQSAIEGLFFDTVEIDGIVNAGIGGFTDTIDITSEVFIRLGQLLECITGNGTNTTTGTASGGGGGPQNYIF